MGSLKIFLDESTCREGLLPFSATRHVADIRIGILTIREKWARFSGVEPVTGTAVPDCISVPAHWIPTVSNWQLIADACRAGKEYEGSDLKKLDRPWQIYEWNDWALAQDFELLTRNESSEYDESNHFINRENIFIDRGAIVSHSILNAEDGPIYIGNGARVMEGSLIRGPFAMLKGSVLKMGARVYGATTLGPYCTAGGEIKNSVFFGYSNKAHDGYLGDSVIGEWCNLGAGTSNSNLKNNASAVKFTIRSGQPAETAGLKGGLLMGDYSRCAINTSFNTGTTVGVCCNIFGAGIPPVHVGDFSWGAEKYELEKALQDIQNWKGLKGMKLTEGEKTMLRNLYSTKTNL